KKKLLRKELPLLLLVSILAGLTLADLELSYVDSLLLLAGLVATMYILFQESDESGEPIVDEDEAAEIESLPTKMAVFWLVSGLVCLMASSKALVWG
ncbi:hypothetical protein Q4563_19065, partial [Gilvimarinus sp. 1_MG-2023]|nr:hypothetical protein [Gilvimarinus sp. 1_MG-2023]